MPLRLYNLTIQAPSAITGSAVGQFSGQKAQEIVVIRGSYVELLRPDPSSGQISMVVSHNTFAILRSIASFRIAGSSKDYILLGSDSGKITVVEYLPEKNEFVSIHCESFGKTGVRRIVPGEYLAVDPKGRAALISSVEKNKLVYVLNRDSQANITISSPLEAHSPRTLVYTTVGIDVGYDNPTFAVIEREYSDSEDRDNSSSRKLTYYELDLGLNHVVKKWTTAVPDSSAFLLAVPGGFDGPSGVLVGMDGHVLYRHPTTIIDSVAIPRRQNDTTVPYIVAGVMHKMRGIYFFIVETQLGDLFKVSVDEDSKKLNIQYFDTISTLAVSLTILKAGFLFVAAEGGDHLFYQFNKLGDDEPFNPSVFLPRSSDDDSANIQLVSRVSSLNPLMQLAVSGSDGSITAGVGRSYYSTLRTIRHGLEINEVVSSELPAAPLAIWTCKTSSSDEFDKYIVLSFSSQTLVLSIGETVEEVSNSGLLGNVQTLAVQQMGRSSLLQIHSKGILQISNGNDDATSEWKPPTGTYITECSTNRYQVVVALSNNSIVYFELDDNGHLNEYEEHKQIPSEYPVVCISLGDVPQGRVRSTVLAVGCADSTIRLFSVDLGTTLEALSIQALTSEPSDVLIMSMGPENRDLHMHIGLKTGVFINTRIDPVTGRLSETRTRFLGPQPIKLKSARINGQAIVLALTTRTWIGHVGSNRRLELVPLATPNLRYAWKFSSSDCPEGIVSISGKQLSIFTVDRLGERFYHESTELQHTPRGFVLEDDKVQAVIETDNLSSTTPNWESLLSVPGEFTSALPQNESAFSVVKCFDGIVVGSSFNQILVPKSCTCGYISYYKNQQLVHRTKVEESPLAMKEFIYVNPTTGYDEKRLLTGVGSFLRLYSNGLKQLLRKAEVDLSPLGVTNITGVDYIDNRIVVSDIRRSVVFVVFKPAINLLVPLADDPVPRAITCMTMLDYNTVVCGDRFGNLAVLRIPEDASEIADEDETAVFLRSEPSYLNGAPHKVVLLNHFYTGEVITSIQLASLVPASSSPEVVVYSGLQGTIGALMPILSRNEFDFFTSLESSMRQHNPSLVGRDHLSFRSYYNPVKYVIDGDLIEQYSALDSNIKEKVADDLDRSVNEVEGKIVDMRVTRIY